MSDSPSNLRLNLIVSARNAVATGFSQVRGEITKLNQDVSRIGGSISGIFSAGAFMAGARAIRAIAEATNEFADAWIKAGTNAERSLTIIKTLERIPVFGEGFATGRNFDEAAYKLFGERLGMAKPKSLEFAETQARIAKQQADADAYSKQRESFHDFRTRVGNQMRVFEGADPRLIQIQEQQDAMRRQAIGLGFPFAEQAKSMVNNWGNAARENYRNERAENADKMIRDYAREQAHQQFLDQQAAWARDDERRRNEQIDGIRSRTNAAAKAIRSQMYGSTFQGAPDSFAVGGRYSGRAIEYQAEQSIKEQREANQRLAKLEKILADIQRNGEEQLRALHDEG